MMFESSATAHAQLLTSELKVKPQLPCHTTLSILQLVLGYLLKRAQELFLLEGS